MAVLSEKEIEDYKVRIFLGDRTYMEAKINYKCKNFPAAISNIKEALAYYKEALEIVIEKSEIGTKTAQNGINNCNGLLEIIKGQRFKDR